jgi:hypothetical protein
MHGRVAANRIDKLKSYLRQYSDSFKWRRFIFPYLSANIYRR